MAPPPIERPSAPGGDPQDLAIERLDMALLPPDGHEPDALETLRAVGGAWPAALTTAVLTVPSALIPVETNFLLNARHPAFARIVVGQPEDPVTDLRLIGSRSPAG